jgi:hypothetical protein
MTPRVRGGATLPAWAAGLLAWFHVDFDPPRRQPRAERVVVATILCVVGSILADAILVKVGTRVFPSTQGYAHFRLSDYGKLTVIGVVIACVAWPVVTRITSRPRWLFSRMAVAVTLVLWLPDVWILLKGQPADAVAVLMAMHLAIALVTYNVLVRVAPTSRRRARSTSRSRDPLTGQAVRVR